jgi:hypothetical protein
MTALSQGMNVDEVEALGRRLQGVAQDFERWTADLERIVNGVNWNGPDADMFKRSWWPQHRGRLNGVKTDLHGFGQSALNNASEQRRASEGGNDGAAAGGGFGSAGGAHTGGGNVGIFGDSLRSVDEQVVPLAGLVSLGGFAFKSLEQGSNTFAIFSAATSGWTIGEHLAEGKYVDAGLDTVEAGGDITAFGLKRVPTVPTYVAGMAVQSWTEALSAARDVDWSMKGLEDIKNASFDDWTGAFADSAKQLPMRIVKIAL